MKNFGTRISKILFYCFLYLVAVNISASYINGTQNTITVKEALSIQAMKAGQRDLLTFIIQKIEKYRETQKSLDNESVG